MTSPSSQLVAGRVTFSKYDREHILSVIGALPAALQMLKSGEGPLTKDGLVVRRGQTLWFEGVLGIVGLYSGQQLIFQLVLPTGAF